MSAKDWKRVSRTIKSRLQEGKESQVVLNGVLLPATKVRRQTYTHDPPTMFASSPSPGPMEGIVVCTPPSTSILEEEQGPAGSSPSLEVVDDVTAHTPLSTLALERRPSSTQLSQARSASIVTTILTTIGVEIIIPDDLPFYVFSKKLNSSGELAPYSAFPFECNQVEQQRTNTETLKRSLSISINAY